MFNNISKSKRKDTPTPPLQTFNKRDVTIIINFENIADGNALFGKVKKKIINFRKLFNTAIGLRVL